MPDLTVRLHAVVISPEWVEMHRWLACVSVDDDLLPEPARRTAWWRSTPRQLRLDPLRDRVRAACTAGLLVAGAWVSFAAWVRA